MDDSDCATFVLFDRDATMLFNKSCADILETHVKKYNSHLYVLHSDLFIS